MFPTNTMPSGTVRAITPAGTALDDAERLDFLDRELAIDVWVAEGPGGEYSGKHVRLAAGQKKADLVVCRGKASPTRILDGIEILYKTRLYSRHAGGEHRLIGGSRPSGRTPGAVMQPGHARLRETIDRAMAEHAARSDDGCHITTDGDIMVMWLPIDSLLRRGVERIESVPPWMEMVSFRVGPTHIEARFA